MAQETDITARTISFTFDDVPLVVGYVGEGRDRKPLMIAVIAGSCEITASGTGKDATWDWESITLSSPLLNYPDVPIRYVRECQTGRELWDWVTQSIARSCTEEIRQLVAESAADAGADAKHEV